MKPEKKRILALLFAAYVLVMLWLLYGQRARIIFPSAGKQRKGEKENLRSERRRQVCLPKDSRLITIHAAIRTTHPDARTQSYRNIQQHIH